MIHLATKRIKNISTFENEIGEIKFVVPEVVLNELEKLATNSQKTKNAKLTLDFIKKWKTITIKGEFADSEIIGHVKKHGGIVATIDKDLKKNVKDVGGSIISLSNDRIVLESS